ncbi:MAG: LacI family transcriptional regulator [bacterium]|nr:LacI family transcriptional regulator [bacterium]
MTTMEEIAKKAGVSQATVSRVINGSPAVGLETRQRVMQWVRKLDYQPNLTAQSLVRKQSFLLGMVLPDISNPYFSEVLKVVEQEAILHGYNIIFCNSNDNIQKEKQSVTTLRGRQVDGILLVPVDSNAQHLGMLGRTNTPVVTITQDVTGFDSVSISHRHGGALVAKHLLETGHTRIGYVGSRKEEKFQGFFDALHNHGIASPDDSVLELENKGAETIVRSHEIHEKLHRYLDRKSSDITAFFTSTDLVALITIHVLQERGYRIPDDFAIVGFDNTFLALEMRPTLTSVAQPVNEIGRVAIETLLGRISGENTSKGNIKVLLEPYLVVRESTRKVKVL